MDFSNITATQNEEAWFDDYVQLVIASEPPQLPPTHQKIGSTETEWFEIEPGKVIIATEGGTIDDRYLAHCVVRSQLADRYVCLAHDMDRDPDEPIDMFEDEEFHTAALKYGSWTDVMAKAKRLIQSGAVQILRNSVNNVVAQVQGDHGSHQTEFSRDDPNSSVITQWLCDCPWAQFSHGRTRQWKKYEDRVCSHALAAYWKALSTPLDEEFDPSNPSLPTQPTPFNAPPGTADPTQGGPGGFDSAPPAMQVAPGEGLEPPQLIQPEQPLNYPAPPGNEILPQFPNPLLPPVNPISVPGLKQPSPLNPIQWPGGTFSSWRFGDTDVSTEDPWANGNLVSLRYDDVGTALGRSEAHGAGQPMNIPAGSVGEILGTDPTGLVNVYYTGPAKQNGPMEPHGVSAWHWRNDLVLRPELKKPGPAVKRR
jgi:hypothetical protein